MEVQFMPPTLGGIPPKCKRHSAPNIRPNQCMGTIGDRVRTERLRLGLSQQALAASVGLKKETVRDLELGKSRSTTKLHNLAVALGVDVAWLETGKGPRLNAAPTENYSQPEPASPSQPLGLNRAILHEALTLLRHDELNAGDYTAQERTDRLLELYGWVAADGGRLSKERNAAFVQSVIGRHQEATGGSSGAFDSTGRRKGRAGTSRH